MATPLASQRINILIYSGPSTSLAAVRHATWSLRRLVGQTYAVLPVTADQLLREPWTASCALLVFPGGADLGYCRALNGDGNRRIQQYVRSGGRYLGFCAGGYYGSAKCEFEVGKKGMEVVGDRELAFYPGICRGLAFTGFVYQSEAGAKAVEIQPNETALPGTTEKFRSYYNGGGAFVDAEKLQDQGVEILASYTEDIDVDVGQAKAAVVYRKFGEGAAIVTGPHPEFSGANLNRDEPSNPNYAELVDALIADDTKRTTFLQACLTKLGLDGLNPSTEPVPSLSPLHLSAAQPSQIADLVTAWREAGILVRDDGDDSGDGHETIRGEQNTFHLTFRPDPPPNRWSLPDLAHNLTSALPAPVQDAVTVAADAVSTAADAVTTAVATVTLSPPSSSHGVPSAPSTNPSRIPDYDSAPLSLIAHSTAIPDPKSTPSFSHSSYFSHLSYFQDLQHPSGRQRPMLAPTSSLGRILVYGEVVTSTSTLLEKNPKLLSHAPTGLVATASTQVAGRGRGANVWVSPEGSLMFSVVLRHPMAAANGAQVVWVQYLAALAVVAGIREYGEGYERLPVRLKWPNDVYVRDPKTTGGRGEGFVKVGGILVNSSYAGGDYTLVVGIGLNVGNAGPTTSLSAVAEGEGLAAFELERLLASVLVQFETIYAGFCTTGFDEALEKTYYDAWLHTDQVVTLEMEDGARARIKGITRDWGMLVAEELGREDRPTGRRWQLQSDSNSFDFFKGLLKRKI